MVLMGLMHLLVSLESRPDMDGAKDRPEIVAPVFAAPQPAMPAGPQEVVNIELDVVTPLFCAAIIAALSAAAPIARRIRTRRAIQRCSAAVALQNHGEFEAAVSEYDAAVRLDRKLVVAYVGRGAVLLRLGRLDEALADLETANRLLPGVAGLLTHRGTIHLERGDFPRALADFNEALRLIPDSSQALVGRGTFWLVQNDLQRAEADFARAIELNPHDAIAFNNRGVVWMKRGDQARAEADFQQAIHLDPSFPNPRQHLAEMEAGCSVS
jgi:tetratricopeptide (TPR) repeat protein